MGNTLRELVESLKDSIGKAQELLSRGFDGLGLYERLALRYLAMSIIETASRACQLLLEEAGESVREPAECFIEASRRGLIPGDLGGRLASAAKKCSVLMYRYWVVDDRRLYEIFKSLVGDFAEYAGIIEGRISE